MASGFQYQLTRGIENKHCKDKISESLEYGLSFSRPGEALLDSLQEDLSNLEKEIGLCSALPDQERIPKLRKAIGHIKIWEHILEGTGLQSA